MVYENIVVLAKARNMTISEVERKAGLSNATIVKWKISSPRLDNLEKVAKVLGVSINRLIRK